MKTLEESHAIGDLCEAFAVSRSGYHRWRAAQPCRRVREDARLTLEIKSLHTQSRGTDGRPRLSAALRQRGERCAPKRVRRLMRAAGVRGVRRGSPRPQTTDSRHRLPCAPNLLKDAAPPGVPDQAWVSDITYIPTQEGWLYVAGVLDRWSRRLLGLAMAARMDAGLPQAALRQALERRGRPRGVILHSDQGVQYASALYQDTLKTFGLIPSMSRRANCYDNAHMESFWGTLKTELLAGKSFATRAQARLAIFAYIETFYNRVRLHSALGYKSPVDFENQTH